MPEAWTGRLLGKMHNNDITYEALAAELDMTKSYVSMLLNSKRKPDGIQKRMEEAVQQIIDRRKNGQG